MRREEASSEQGGCLAYVVVLETEFSRHGLPPAQAQGGWSSTDPSAAHCPRPQALSTTSVPGPGLRWGPRMSLWPVLRGWPGPHRCPLLHYPVGTGGQASHSTPERPRAEGICTRLPCPAPVGTLEAWSWPWLPPWLGCGPLDPGQPLPAVSGSLPRRRHPPGAQMGPWLLLSSSSIPSKDAWATGPPGCGPGRGAGVSKAQRLPSCVRARSRSRTSWCFCLLSTCCVPATVIDTEQTAQPLPSWSHSPWPRQQ